MIAGRSSIERGCGLQSRENAGMSSESVARTHTIESLRFSGEGPSTQSKSGAKARPKGVVDEQLVDIPVLPNIDKELKR